jgi:aryl-alcohol dehydrogenase-like predicted oxidoreductase
MKRRIGKTGVEVNAIGFGGMTLSIAGRINKPEAIKVIHAALDAGIDFIDTANVYCVDDNDLGHNEDLIKKTLQNWRSDKPIYIATKGGLRRPDGEWITNGHPKELRRACENSIKALGVDHLFLYQLHAIDSKVPLADSVGEISRLQEEGKILHIGLSNVTADELNYAQKIVRIETVQNRFSPMCQRDLFNGVIAACQEQQVTYIAYSPVGGGRHHTQMAEHPVLVKIAQDHQAAPHQIMLSWCLSKGNQMLPIPGASKVRNVISSATAAQIQLNSEEIQEIDNFSVPA